MDGTIAPDPAKLIRDVWRAFVEKAPTQLLIEIGADMNYGLLVNAMTHRREPHDMQGFTEVFTNLKNASHYLSMNGVTLDDSQEPE